MNTQETIIKLIEEGLPMLLNGVKAMPEEKLTWKPAETARTAMEVAAEAVSMLSACAGMLENRGMSKHGDDESRPTTVAELEAAAKEGAAKLYAVIRAFPEADFEKTLDLPWGKMSFFQIMSYPYWNIMWHAGQINYIQTLYGDTEMH